MAASQAIKTTGSGERNKRFLSVIDQASKDDILKSIARHYGVTSQKIFNEVVHPEAEDILDYMIEPHRTAAWALMQRHAAVLAQPPK